MLDLLIYSLISPFAFPSNKETGVLGAERQRGSSQNGHSQLEGSYSLELGASPLKICDLDISSQYYTYSRTPLLRAPWGNKGLS